MVWDKELSQNWESFNELIHKSVGGLEEPMATLIKRYADHNLRVLNEILTGAIHHLTGLHLVKSSQESLLAQARLTEDLGKKLMKAAQGFYELSLEHVTSYNETLKETSVVKNK